MLEPTRVSAVVLTSVVLASSYAIAFPCRASANPGRAAALAGESPRHPASTSKQGSSGQYTRHRLEQIFGKYFTTCKGFEIYGVTKRDGSWDSEDESAVSGVIVGPTEYSHIHIKAELKFPVVVNGKAVTQTVKTSTNTDASFIDIDKLNIAHPGEKPEYKDICHSRFMWSCPKNVDPTSLRLTELTAQ